MDRERAARRERHVESRPAPDGVQDGHRLRQDGRNGHAHRLAHAQHSLEAASQDARFSDAFLIVTPGITIRDRLRVLLPNDPENYYRQRDIVSPEQQEQLLQAKIVITNFHAFQLREKIAASKITKSILGKEWPDKRLFTETPDQMVRYRLPRTGQQALKTLSC